MDGKKTHRSCGVGPETPVLLKSFQFKGTKIYECRYKDLSMNTCAHTNSRTTAWHLAGP